MKIRTTLLLFVIGLTCLRAQIAGGPPIIVSLVPPATLANLSCRTFVGTDTGVAIAGFVVTGQAGSSAQVLIRGVGPALSQFSLPGALAQPVLTLFDSSGKVLAINSGWGTNANSSQVSGAFASTGAFALSPGSADSALLVSLSPGNYTAQVSGLNHTTGMALIEVYAVPPEVPPSPVVPPPVTTPGAGTG